MQDIESNNKRSLRAALLDFAVLMATLFGPLALGAATSLGGSAALVGATVILELLVRGRWQRPTSWMVTGAIIGLSINLFMHAPAYWNWLIAPLVLLVGLAVQGICENRTVGSAEDTNKLSTPEGRPIRILGHHEHHFGYVYAHDYLMPDGVVLTGWGTSTAFSPEGRYFAADCDGDGLDVLDRRQRRMFHYPYCSMFTLEAFTDDTLQGQSRRSDEGKISVPLQDILDRSKTADLVAVADLWLPPALLQQLPEQTRSLPAPPAGSHRLTTRFNLPKTLLKARRPLLPLQHPRFELVVDGQPSGKSVGADGPIVWRADGNAFCCHARDMNTDEDEPTTALWLWQADTGWHNLNQHCPWRLMGKEAKLYSYHLGVHYGSPATLTSQAIRINAQLSFPNLAYGNHGVVQGMTSGLSERVIGYTADGHMQVEKLEGTRFCIEMPLHGGMTRARVAVISMPLADGNCVRMTWKSTRPDGLERWQCSIGDWHLPGDYWLDHRVSDDGQHVALIPVPKDSTSPLENVVIADIVQRRLLHGPPQLVTRLLDFRGNVLSLIAADGRLSNGTSSTALQRFQIPAPAPAQGTAFMADQEDSELYYGVHELRVTNDALEPVPRQRLAHEPQSVLTADDYLLPAPDGRDAAWVFGATTKFNDGWPRPREPRQGAFLLTASGCALGNLSPAAMWSQDSRYLLLTRQLPSDNAMPSPWQLLLLDPAMGRLYEQPDPIGMRPGFVRFDADGITLYVHTRDMMIQGDLGRPRHVSLDTLLQQPHIELETHGNLKLAPDQQVNLELWQSLDKQPLEPWMAAHTADPRQQSS